MVEAGRRLRASANSSHALRVTALPGHSEMGGSPLCAYRATSGGSTNWPGPGMGGAVASASTFRACVSSIMGGGGYPPPKGLERNGVNL